MTEDISKYATGEHFDPKKLVRIFQEQMAIKSSGVQFDPGQAIIGEPDPIDYRSEIGMKTGSSLLSKIFDILSRGNYASANIAKDYIAGKPLTAKAFMDGIKGNRKNTYSDDIVPEVWPEWGKAKQFSMGLLLDIFADPTTYIPIETIPNIVRKTGVTEKVIKPLAESKVLKSIRPRAGLPTKYYNKKYFAKKALEAKNQRVIDDIYDLGKGLNKSDMENLFYYREHPNMVKYMPDKLKGKLEDIGNILDEQIDDLVKAGTISPDTAKKWLSKETPYAPHQYEGMKGANVSSDIPPSMSARLQKPGFLKQRKFETIDDAEKLSAELLDISKSKTLRDAQGKILKYELDGMFNDNIVKTNLESVKSQALAGSKFYQPEKNILKALGRRSIEQNNWLAKKAFVDDVVKEFGEKVPYDTKFISADKGLYYPKGKLRFYAEDVVGRGVLDKFDDLIPKQEIDALFRKHPALTKKVPVYAMDRSIAEDMNKAGRFFGGDENTHAFLKLIDKPQNAWKSMATTVRLPFHLRNMYSNWWQAYAAGIPSYRLADAMARSAGIQSGALKSVNLGGKVFKRHQLIKTMEDVGVLNKGWIASDININNMKELSNVIRFGRFKNLNPVELGRNFGRAIENNARVAVFMDQVSKGKSFEEAALQTKKYLFDYTELTDIEKNFFRRAIPFYSWMRKNIPLQIETLLTKPQKIQRLGKALNAYGEKQTAEEKKLMPEYFNELMYVKSPFKTESGKDIYTSIDLPPMEWNRMQALKRSFFNNLTPYKLIFELKYNVKSFPDISEIGGPLEKTQAPFYIQFLPEKTKKFMKDHNIIAPIYPFGEDDPILGIDKKTNYAMGQMFPFLNELNRINQQPIYMDKEAPKMKLRSYMSGVGHNIVNKELREKMKMSDAYEEEKVIREFYLQHRVLPTDKQMDKLGVKELKDYF